MHVRAEVVRRVGVKSVRSRVRVFPRRDSVCLLAHSKIHILQSYFMTIYISARRRFVRRYVRRVERQFSLRIIRKWPFQPLDNDRP